jgi:hypothetical protein
LDNKKQRFGFSLFGGEAVAVGQGDKGLGDSLITTLFPSLTVDPLNRPIITLGVKGSGTANSDLIVKRWNGSRWTTLGGVVDRIATRNVDRNKILVDSKGVIYAIWQECAGSISAETGCSNNNIYVSKYVP